MFWGLMELKQGGTVGGRVTEQTSGHEQLGRCLAESKAQCQVLSGMAAPLPPT